MTDGPIILFDGACNLCHGGVRFVARRDPRGVIRFAALQSEAGRKLLRQHNLPTDRLGSMVLIDNGVAAQRSDTLVGIARHLRAPWPWIGKVFGCLPRFLREALYRFVAGIRYRLFGRRTNHCPMIPDDLAERMMS